MILSELREWFAGLDPSNDTAPLCVLSSEGIPFAATGVSLAGANDGSGTMIAVTGPGQRVCGDWTAMATLDSRPAVLCEPREPNRSQHEQVSRYMAGFFAGASGKPFKHDDHSDPDWRHGWNAGTTAKAVAYVEACAIYNTEINLRRTQENPRAAAVPYLIELAKLSLNEYLRIGFDAWIESPAVSALSDALTVGGFPHLALAVCNGHAWSEKIAAARDEVGLGVIEQEASGPEFSWNEG